MKKGRKERMKRERKGTKEAKGGQSLILYFSFLPS
jgi:hypothetical protein